MAGAPTLASTQLITGTLTADLTSAPISVTTGDVLVVKAVNEQSGSPTFLGVTAPGQTFLTAAAVVVAGYCEALLCTCVVTGNPGTLTVTLSCDQAGAAGVHSMVVERWTGAQLATIPATNAVRMGTNPTPSTAVTTTAANSAVTWLYGDYSANPPGVPGYRSGAVGEGVDDKSATGSYVAYYAYQATGAAGVQTIGVTTPGASSVWTILGVEVQGSITGASTPPGIAATLTATGAVTTTPPVITLRGVGTPSAAIGSVTTCTPSVPAGVQAGDLSLLSVVAKPYNTTITTPVGWTKIGETTNGSTGSGPDTGSTKTAVFYQSGIVAEGPIPPIGQDIANSMVAGIVTYATTKSQWDVSGWTTGNQPPPNQVNYSVTSAAGLTLTGGDRLVAVTGLNTDLMGQGQDIFSVPGAVLVDLVTRVNAVCSTADDVHLFWRDLLIHSGSSSGVLTEFVVDPNPVAGSTIYLRLRTAGVPLTAGPSDPVGVTDSVSAVMDRRVVITETLAPADSMSPQVISDTEVITDPVSLVDQVTTGLQLGASFTVTAAAVAVGAAGRAEAAFLPASATAVAAGVNGRTGATSWVVTATTAAAGEAVAHIAVLPVTATGTAAGSVAAGASGAAVLAVTATRTGGAVMAATGGAVVAVTVTLPVLGGTTESGDTTLVITVTRAAAGRANLTTGTTTTLTATRSAAGSVSTPPGSSQPTNITAARPAAGTAAAGLTTTLTVTAAGIAAGRAGLSTTSTAIAVTATRTGDTVLGGPGLSVPTAVTATRTGAGTVNRATGASVRVTGTLTAGGVAGYTDGSTAPKITIARRAGGIAQDLPTSLMADLWYQSLPAAYRQADSEPSRVNRKRVLYRYLASIMHTLHDPEVTAERIAAGDLTDPVRADDAWIPWLAQAVGVQGTTIAQLRARLIALATAPALGSAPYMTALIKPYLTGTQFLEFFPQPPWTIVARVLASELGTVGGTTDGLKAAVYATGRVPTGYLLDVTTTGQLWSEIDAVSTDWADRPPTESWHDVDTAGL